MADEHPDQGLPDVVTTPEPDEDQAHQRHEAGGLGCHGQERGDRGGCALVGVRGPGVERHRRHLEGEAEEHEHDAEGDDGLGGRQAADLRCDLDQQRAAGEAVDDGHAVEHDRRGEHTHQVVLQPRLVALEVTLAPRREHVGGDREQLEGDEDADEVAGRCHDHHAQHRRQDHLVVLALPVVALGDVVRREEHDEVGRQQEQGLEHQRIGVDDVAAAEHDPVHAVVGQGGHRDQGDQQADAGDRRGRPPLLVTGERVDHEEEDQRRGDDDLGRESVEVDAGCVPRERHEMGEQRISSRYRRRRRRCGSPQGW